MKDFFAQKVFNLTYTPETENRSSRRLSGKAVDVFSYKKMKIKRFYEQPEEEKNPHYNRNTVDKDSPKNLSESSSSFMG